MDIFLAILEDTRHDVKAQPCDSYAAALAQVGDWIEEHGTRYCWVSENIDGWLFYLKTTCEDGPFIHIEKSKLRTDTKLKDR